MFWGRTGLLFCLLAFVALLGGGDVEAFTPADACNDHACDEQACDHHCAVHCPCTPVLGLGGSAPSPVPPPALTARWSSVAEAPASLVLDAIFIPPRT